MKPVIITGYQHLFVQIGSDLPSLYPIFTKHGDIIDRLTRNLSEKFKAYPIIRHYVTAQNNVFCLIFITISTPIFTKLFGQLWKPYWKVFANFQNDLQISFKELKISSNNTSKIIEFRQITRVLDIFLLPKPRITNFGT